VYSLGGGGLWSCVYVGRGEGMVGRCENAITRIVCVSAGRCECVRGARIITKYRELIKHIVGARRLDNRYKLPPRAKQLTGETRAYSTRSLSSDTTTGSHRGGRWRLQSSRDSAGSVDESLVPVGDLFSCHTIWRSEVTLAPKLLCIII